eukprot:CAMPEP_0194265410 /NCGR_PEP_ID=MMETSP0169-20130528/660_1 /TAXON_ID=218684 /ORGANISM="Corethron pennatum, Strain L29A3" /LENGTH=166 /DNA_ID=CAMNT_0039005867 /DNA_START=113 /DNA_END=613 /DNA_ORIENTATION=+
MGTDKVPGPDCVEPACNDKISMFKKSLGGRAAFGTAVSTPSATAGPVNDGVGCPPTKDAIGISTWTLLHTTAAYYPEKPAAADRAAAENLVASLTRLYPCTHCREDFTEEVRASPPATESRTALCRWMCEQHNKVNEKLNKGTFRCDMEHLDRRWRFGDPRCYEED